MTSAGPTKTRSCHESALFEPPQGLRDRVVIHRALTVPPPKYSQPQGRRQPRNNALGASRPERATDRDEKRGAEPQRQTQPTADGTDAGRMTSAVTGLDPWIGHKIPERASV